MSPVKKPPTKGRGTPRKLTYEDLQAVSQCLGLPVGLLFGWHLSAKMIDKKVG